MNNVPGLNFVFCFLASLFVYSTFNVFQFIHWINLDSHFMLRNSLKYCNVPRVFLVALLQRKSISYNWCKNSLRWLISARCEQWGPTETGSQICQGFKGQNMLVSGPSETLHWLQDLSKWLWNVLVDQWAPTSPYRAHGLYITIHALNLCNIYIPWCLLLRNSHWGQLEVWSMPFLSSWGGVSQGQSTSQELPTGPG